jgi:aspartyl-tRNA synthetase
MEMVDVSELVRGCEFKVFNTVLEKGGVVKALRVEGGAKLSRGEIDQMTELAKTHGGKGLAYFVYEEGNIKSPIRKFLTDEQAGGITRAAGAQTGDVVFFGADQFNVACEVLGQVRLACAEKFKLLKTDEFAYCWVHQFPMFEKDPESGGVSAMHHPFTRPMDEDREILAKDPLNARAQAYDIVLNGNEIGGGSIRIHEPELQKQVFDILKVTPEDAERKFGHLLNAFKYGAPAHGGIAWGLDRLIMLFAGEENIREVIAFPMNQKAQNTMMGAPGTVAEKLLTELGLKLVSQKT